MLFLGGKGPFKIRENRETQTSWNDSTDLPISLHQQQGFAFEVKEIKCIPSQKKLSNAIYILPMKKGVQTKILSKAKLVVDRWTIIKNKQRLGAENHI